MNQPNRIAMPNAKHEVAGIAVAYAFDSKTGRTPADGDESQGERDDWKTERLFSRINL
jgi:hypothetical protein